MIIRPFYITCFTPKCTFIKVLFCFFWWISITQNTQAQVVDLICQEENVAVLDLDRKDWNGGSTAAHSEASMHNFDLPSNTFGDCKFISNIEINLTVFSVDISGLTCTPPGAYYINIATGCPSFAPASCDVSNLVDEPNSPTLNTTSLSYNSPPEDFQFGENLSIDIVPVMDTSCPNGQSAISSGEIILDYQICVTVTISNQMIDTPADLGMDMTICPDGTTMLDPGTYDEYAWDPNGEITPTIDVGPGMYTVTVTDMNGCTDTDDITISQHPDSGITFDPVAPTVCDNGTVDVSVNENYTSYDWSNFLSGQTVSLSTGSYDVTITDSNNCTAVNSVVVSNVDPPHAGMNNFEQVCNDGTTYNFVALLIDPDTGGTWSDDNASGVDVNINPTAVDFTGILPGTYDFTYTVTGVLPCPPDQAIITIEVSEQNFAGTSEVMQYCPDPGNLDFSLLLGGPDPGGLWSDLDGANVDLNDPFAVNFDGVTEGTYDFEYLLQENGACSEQTATLTIVILPSANAGMDDEITVCEGTIVDLLPLVNGANASGTFFDTDVSGALSGSMVNTSGLAGQSFTFTFTVGTISSPCGQDDALFIVNIESSLSAGDDVLDSFCTEGDIDLYDVLMNEDPGGTFTDVNTSGGLMGNILTTTNITPGTYSYQYQIGDGVTCPVDDAEITLTFFEDPNYNFSQSEIDICVESCADIEVSLSGSSPYDFPIEIYSATSGNLMASTNVAPAGNSYSFTICNSTGDIEFVNDTLHLISDSIWFAVIPMINDANCSGISPNNPDTLFINTISNSYYQVDTTACITDTVMIGGIMFFDGNAIFQDTIQGMTCDSIIDISVTFTNSDTITIDSMICFGDSVMIEGIWFDESFTSTEIEVSNDNGCDSLIIINVSSYPLADSLLNLTLCTGDSIVVNDEVYKVGNETGTEILPGEASTGCDSIVIISLQFTNDIMWTIDDTLCADGFIEIGGSTFDINTPEGQVMFTQSGCDTIVDVDLSFHEIADSSISGFYCRDFSIDVNGTVYDIDFPNGSTILIDSSQHGCDSIVNVDLQFYEIADSLITGTYCSDYSIVINGNTYDINNTFGSEIATEPDQYGCDSIIDIDLNFYMPVSTNFDAPMCDNDSIEINGVFYGAMRPSGVEVILGGTINGCDSTVVIQLDIKSTYNEMTSDSICAGDSIFLEGAWQFTAGTYTEVLQSIDLCDSIITTELTVLPCTVNVELNGVNNDCAFGSLGSITLNILSDIQIPYTVLWEGQDSGVSGSQSIDTDQGMVNISNLSSDNYTITIQDAGGVTIYQNSIEIIDSNPAIDGMWVVLDSILCAGELGSLEFQTQGGQGPYSYNWDPTTIGDSQMAENVEAGEYFLTITDDLGCTQDTSFIFTEPEPFVASVATLQLSCEGSSDGQISIDAISGGVLPYVVTFNNLILDSLTVMGLDTGTYQIEVIDANDCRVSFTEVLTAANNADLGMYTENYQITTGDSVMLEGTVLDSSFTFSWEDSDGSLSCTDCANPVVNPLFTTVYSLTIMDSLGCTQSIIINVEVEQKQLVNIHSNVFSPNGDNSNDEFIFRINDSGVLGIALSIYDRWGNLVFNGQTLENEISWDGTRNGKILNSGVFVYRAVVQYEDGTSDMSFGDVMLMN